MCITEWVNISKHFRPGWPKIPVIFSHKPSHLNRKRHPIFDSEPDGYRCQVSTSPDGKSRGYGFVRGPAVELLLLSCGSQQNTGSLKNGGYWGYPKLWPAGDSTKGFNQGIVSGHHFALKIPEVHYETEEAAKQAQIVAFPCFPHQR